MRSSPPTHLVLLREPFGRADETGAKQRDVEAPGVIVVLGHGQQVEEKRTDTGVGQHSRDKRVARTVARAAAAVRERHDAQAAVRERERALQPLAINENLDSER